MNSCVVGATLLLPSHVRGTMGLGVPPDLVSEPMRALPGSEPGLGIYCCLLPAGLEDLSNSE